MSHSFALTSLSIPKPTISINVGNQISGNFEVRHQYTPDNKISRKFCVSFNTPTLANRLRSFVTTEE